jgi:Uma2 family endonuclease
MSAAVAVVSPPLPAPALEQDEQTLNDTDVRPRRWTRDEYYRAGELGLLPPNERVELIEGEIIQIVSPKYPPHTTGVFKTRLAVEAIFPAGFVVRAQEPISLPNDSEPEPDVVVAPGCPDDYADRHPGPADVRLLVEVSDTTLGYDRNRKAAIYAEAGIADYWILSLRSRRLEVRRDPIVLPPGEQRYRYGYRTVTIYLETEEVSPLAAPQSRVRVADLLPPPQRTTEHQHTPQQDANADNTPAA